MTQYKNKYLQVKRRSDGNILKRVDVGHLNKKGREAMWDELDKQYPPQEHVNSYVTSQAELPIIE